MQKQPENKIFHKLIGVWKLIECVRIEPDGTLSYPWGQDVLGYIIYTIEGIMAVQIMRKKRTTQGTPEELMIAHDYDAYFGPFEIDEANQTVIHHVEGHLDPYFIGKKRIRTFKFSDNILELTTQGEIDSRKLTWQKVT